MPNLKFNQLLLISNSSQSANQFEFHPRLNLITSEDNTVGKSTLVKIILWTLGCEPELDSTWNALDCRSLLYFNIGAKNFYIYRHKSQICLYDINNRKRDIFEKVSDFSKTFADLVNFKFRLLDRQNNLVIPPPAFYFLPFYVDQKKSWTSIWNSFDKLSQFSKWQSDLVKYNVGLLSDRHFEIIESIFNKKSEKLIYRNRIDAINTTFGVIEEYIPHSVYSINEKVVDEITKEIQEELVNLSKKQESLYDNLSIIETERIMNNHQLKILEQVILEFDKDYVFSVENIASETVECPLCGVLHSNSIINRASILTDKISAESQLETLSQAIQKLDNQASQYKSELLQIKLKIDLINKKYITVNDKQINLADAIDGMAAASIRSKVTNQKKEYLLSESDLQKDINVLEKEKKDLKSKEDKEAVNENFMTIFMSLLKDLDVKINLSSINSPLDYPSISREGGSADGTRKLLAYYLSIYTMICNLKNQAISPLIIDTPNQQEQSNSNYDKIISVLINTPEQNQIFLCGMKNEHLLSVSKDSKIFELDKNKILKQSLYNEIKEKFEKLSLV